MTTLLFSAFWGTLKAAIVPAVLICIQIKLSAQKKIIWPLAFIGIVAAVFLANYIFLANSAPAGELKKLSMNLENGNRAEMYVRETKDNEIIAYSEMKVVHPDGTILDRAAPVQGSHYEPVISELTGGRSLAESVYEEEESLADPKNRIFEWGERLYMISAEALLWCLGVIITALALIFAAGRFLYKDKI